MSGGLDRRVQKLEQEGGDPAQSAWTPQYAAAVVARFLAGDTRMELRHLTVVTSSIDACMRGLQGSGHEHALPRSLSEAALLQLYARGGSCIWPYLNEPEPPPLPDVKAAPLWHRARDDAGAQLLKVATRDPIDGSAIDWSRM